ncbi:Uncharacterized protein MCB1EB_1327 [Mycoavidus cysteinexigens]|uniref:Uncharacterized protein n=1 Tax=Mycoavidus cysteinexigens TaxID=1553431 RepID=A0A2Z6EVN5_9BURK|nr:hypothetical protein [Mycoavidus cysteinexigens]BBE09488.1 Uncharacterized protein MCB1EB_1327 [Mycoavidus cysteinexigens]GAM51754.1 hypothetical protein EBME_0217 [bacterium endosymbiont of Mortierella elongata FMR23-6]GLR01310.1 hypothetical protein GCM10007934_11220 [Mycoavidus cysteinexigens]
MVNTIGTATQSSTFSSTLVYSRPLVEGEAALRLATTQQKQDPESALKSLDIAEKRFRDVLTQSQELSLDERRDVQANLAQVFLLREDILRGLSTVKEASANDNKAREHEARDAEQRSSSQQASREGRGGTKLQMIGGLVSIASAGPGNISDVDYQKTDNDQKFLEQIGNQYTQNMNHLRPMFSQPQAASGEDHLYQFSFGVIAGATAGENNRFNVRYGVNNAIERDFNQANADAQKK